MFSKRFLIVLFILFIAAFWWAGGNSLTGFFPKIIPASTSQQASDISARIKRILFLKQTVNDKLKGKEIISLNNIPLQLQQAIIAIEDNRFYTHYGFDIEGILRAMLVNLQKGEIVEGGSTITQQLAKNLFLSQEQTMIRKLEEFILALDFELVYSKEEILELYLNTIYFGSGSYGIKDAAKNYFDKAPDELTLSECALLAGIPNAPSLYSPYENLHLARMRQSIVLSAMVKQGYIGPSLANKAKQAPIYLAK